MKASVPHNRYPYKRFLKLKKHMSNNSYYTFKPASNTPETGSVYPQIQKLKPGYDDKKNNSIYSYLKKSIGTFSNEEPDLDGFILHSYAKPTDLVSNTITDGYGFFVSQKLKSILEKHHLPLHRFYPAKVTHKGKLIEDYFWLHIVSDLTDAVDYAESIFFIYKHYRTNEGYIKINSKEQYITTANKIKLENPGINITIWSEKICLSPQFDKKTDCFKIGLFDSFFYISQSLKNALVENNITGYELHQTDKVVIK
jgi:hypothetical protein